MPPPRILIASTGVGAGHLRAAEAIEQAFKRVRPDVAVRNIDVLARTNRLFRWSYAQTYIDMVNQAPYLFGYFYDLLDARARVLQPGDHLRIWLEKMQLHRFIQLLQSEPWDLVINTHFLPAEIIASLRRCGRVSMPQATVVTDLELHRVWINQPCECYFTATAEAGIVLEAWGVSPARIVRTGIPVHPMFTEARDRQELLAKHVLAADRPIVLQLAGGLGVGPIAQMYKALLHIEPPTQFVVVAGKNERLKKQLETIAVPGRHRSKIYGFTREMDELMFLADLVVSKPGGLTTAESLARGAVMVIVNPVPGQETRNSDWLLENGAGIKVNHPTILAKKVSALLGNPTRLAKLKENVLRVARPRAAFDVVEQAMKLIGK